MMDKAAVFAFLEDLRDSGEVNMFGAGAYVVEEFGVSNAEAKEVLGEWMDSFI